MRIGIDFDNTIACYDKAFHAIAVSRGLVPQTLPVHKDGVRDFLRAAGREDEWTLLQGHVYGTRMDLAEPFPGVLDAMRRAVQSRHELRIISHKTRHPYLGPKHDLHAAARGFLDRLGLFGSGIGLDPSAVLFNLTKEEKLESISTERCDVFIDDLPEFLAEERFPAATNRWLFDPHGNHAGEMRFARFTSWARISEALCAHG